MFVPWFVGWERRRDDREALHDSHRDMLQWEERIRGSRTSCRHW
ncbi:hypothetical protein [Okeania hirsuta]|nr:hypothetical protein [Okeania hirsuta]